MIKILTVCINPTRLNAIILMIFEERENHNKIKLKEIHLFKRKKEVNNFVERNNLKLIEDINRISRKDVQNLIGLINSYLLNGKIDLFEGISELGIELDLQEKFPSSFSQNVVNNLINLKPGETTTYSKIGSEIGSKAYRAIGNVCKSNPIPLVVPCHRVLKKNGELGGFMGKSDETWETNLKKQLLKLEGYQI
ncbi:MAG: methylated-DNA--[protein]-cysteine S-methyltransferase [Promethearchaeota archaeon]